MFFTSYGFDAKDHQINQPKENNLTINIDFPYRYGNFGEYNASGQYDMAQNTQ